MRIYVMGVFALLALLGLFVGAVTGDRRKNLWGNVGLSVFLGALLWVFHGSYLVVLLSIVLLFLDLILYFFGTSVAMPSERREQESRADKFYRAFVLWLLAIGGSSLVALVYFNSDSLALIKNENSLNVVLHSLWTDAWWLVVLIVVMLVLASVGAFFLSGREERQ